ncbi:FliM/FliN family flagellar motor C-terminal domain-containing protein [Sphingobium sp. BYY-5]|uniref:FliM/FliN family flagellar motor switch protein n=1 Tax=Sphingobium sp. BYY-5 TaxID=2926400 RepID=UPI001FA762E8|nr:FliM/FliN family flagellar motor switch protein [Sphingobium sp. BYY-5]MCI4592623.1 FliM/FliN family flagellar motor C-terminal domain-containing protein [Sphingobium sp. BYY-5]
MDDTDAPTISPTPVHPAFPADDFQVQLRFELDQADVPLARLQAVQEGGVLPLQDRDGALAVRILAGSRAIATGQIVSIGDSYGVLIETILKES